MGARLQHTGSTRAFRGLYVEHYGFVWGIARRMGVRPDVVDDVVQDAFLTAFRRLSDLPAERPRAWLYGITRRVSSNYRRQERRRSRKHDALAVARPGAVEVEGRLAAGRAVDRFLDGLEERDRELFILGEIEGLTGAELAAALQARPSTLYGRLQALRERFRQEMGPAAPECLRARAAGRPRGTAARWALLQPMLASSGLPVAGLGVVGAGAAWGKLVLGAAAIVAVTGATSPLWGSEGKSEGKSAATPPTPPTPPTISASTSTSRTRSGPLHTVAAAPLAEARPDEIGPPAAEADTVARLQTEAPPSTRPLRSRATARAAASSPSPASKRLPPDGLAAEAELVRKATAALSGGDPRAALGWTAQHRARFPQGALVDAAGALRIEALCADGQTRQARDEARMFLRDRSKSPVAARVRRACAEEKDSRARNPSPGRTQP